MYQRFYIPGGLCRSNVFICGIPTPIPTAPTVFFEGGELIRLRSMIGGGESDWCLSGDRDFREVGSFD
ncbi:MAG: hypothetical protein DMG59_03005 [Acidobacteria bacterium]|nr:MAG: hypothetical protein DMG59_03005 [Acidobacteriota bacterium]